MPRWWNGRHEGLKKLSAPRVTVEVESVKFGETFKKDGNPEPTLC